MYSGVTEMLKYFYPGTEVACRDCLNMDTNEHGIFCALLPGPEIEAGRCKNRIPERMKKDDQISVHREMDGR